MFLSNLVFGEAKARFLLPWKRLFNVSDAQIALACKTNGEVMFKKYLNTFPEPAAADLAMLQVRPLPVDAPPTAPRRRGSRALRASTRGLKGVNLGLEGADSRAERGGVGEKSGRMKTRDWPPRLGPPRSLSSGRSAAAGESDRPRGGGSGE